MTQHEPQSEVGVRNLQKNHNPDPVGLAVRRTLRAEMLADIGVDVTLLARTVAVQAAALNAVWKDGSPHWMVRLKAAEALQALGVPRQHGNLSGTSHVVKVEFPDWFKALPARNAMRDRSTPSTNPQSLRENVSA